MNPPPKIPNKLPINPPVRIKGRNLIIKTNEVNIMPKNATITCKGSLKSISAIIEYSLRTFIYKCFFDNSQKKRDIGRILELEGRFWIGFEPRTKTSHSKMPLAI